MNLVWRAVSFIKSFRETRAAFVEKAHARAATGNPSAQYDLGERYFGGLGVQKDFAEAFRWFYLAAQQGHAKAQANVGLMYFLGRGVPQDLIEAYRWLELAAAQDNNEAITALHRLSRRLTSDEIAEAKKRAAERLARTDPNLPSS